nr:tigger transposable element-derived protein 6-like [Parasteatoda tepidariorum]
MPKRKDLSLKDKFEVLQNYDKLPKCSQREAAIKLGISQTALFNILKQRINISEEIKKNGNLSRKRKREGKSEEIEMALLEWFKNARERRIPISRGILFHKAQDFANLFGDSDFKATDGWLTRWKERNNIVYRKLHGEKQDADFSSAADWVNDVWPTLIKDYKPEQIFNTDETGLFFRALPEHTLLFKNESTGGCKKMKERLTVLLTCNMTGTVKKNPLVIGKSLKPRCFKGVKHLPTSYANSYNAWMTSSIFTKFLLEWDKELKNEKVVLLLDNCSAHPADEDLSLKNIKLVFLPPNTTAIIQPLDQGIIRSFKFHYRKMVVQKIISDIDCDSSSELLTANKLSKSLTILESMHLIRNSWDIVSTQTISNCFKKCGLSTGDGADNCFEEMLSNEENDMDENFSCYVAIDDHLQTSGEKSDSEIVTDIKNCKVISNQEMEESDSEDEINSSVPSSTEVRKALNHIVKSLETA